MGLVRRFVGVVLLLPSLVGTVGSVAGILAIWMLFQGVSERLQRITDKLDGGLQRVSAANRSVLLAVGKARDDVSKLGKESTDLSGSGNRSRRAARTIRKLIQQQAGPDMDDLGGRLATLSDSAIALSSLLESFQEVPLARVSRIDSDQLQRRADEARKLSSILRRLDRTLDDKDGENSRREVSTVTSEVDLVLQKCQITVNAWQADLDETRNDLAHVKATILGWLTCAAIVVTLLCAWIGAGQVSLFATALRWCRGRGGQDYPRGQCS